MVLLLSLLNAPLATHFFRFFEMFVDCTEPFFDHWHPSLYGPPEMSTILYAKLCTVELFTSLGLSNLKRIAKIWMSHMYCVVCLWSLPLVWWVMKYPHSSPKLPWSLCALIVVQIFLLISKRIFFLKIAHVYFQCFGVSERVKQQQSWKMVQRH